MGAQRIQKRRKHRMLKWQFTLISKLQNAAVWGWHALRSSVLRHTTPPRCEISQTALVPSILGKSHYVHGNACEHIGTTGITLFLHWETLGMLHLEP